MKKLLLTVSLISLVSGAYAQGQINLGNISNYGTGLTATTGGLFWVDLDGPPDFAHPLCGNPPSLINTDFNVNFYGASDANNLVLLKSVVASGGGAALGPGTFLDLSGQPVTIPGALTSAFFRIDAWIGPASTFSSATFRGQTPIFSNPLGNPNGQPPGLPTDFTGMPAILIGPLSCVPEPGTFALAGMGCVALLIFCRRAD